MSRAHAVVGRVEARAAHLELLVLGEQLLQLGLRVDDERRGGAGLPLGWHHRHRAGLRPRLGQRLFDHLCPDLVYLALSDF